MKVKMKTVRREMNAGDLKGIIDLPNYDDNQRVEVTVMPTEEQKKLSPEEIEKNLSELAGILSHLDKSKTLTDWRMERLAEKYEIAD